MTILFLVRRFWPGVGGVETHVLRIAEEMVKDGHRVKVIGEDIDGDWQKGYKDDKRAGGVEKVDLEAKMRSDKEKLLGKPHPTPLLRTSNVPKAGEGRISEKEENVNGIIIFRIPKVKDSWVKKFFIWMWLWNNRQLIKSADVVHAHDVFFWYFPFRLLYPKKKAFVTFHGYEGTYPPARKAIWMRRISEHLAMGNICVGDFIKKWYGTVPNFVTYGGVEKRKLRIENGELRIKKKHPIKILFVGRLEKDTGIPIYLEALAAAQKIDFDFEACGDGMLRGEVEKYGKVHGFVDDVEKHIKDADIIFASSYLSILQALVYGKLVISVYDNPLKEDYLRMAPFSEWIQIVNTQAQMSIEIEQYIASKAIYQKKLDEAQAWAQIQTWKNVTNLYYNLWSITKIRQK